MVFAVTAVYAGFFLAARNGSRLLCVSPTSQDRPHLFVSYFSYRVVNSALLHRLEMYPARKPGWCRFSRPGTNTESATRCLRLRLPELRQVRILIP